MSQIRVDKTAIVKVDLPALDKVVRELASKRDGFIEEHAKNWTGAKSVKSDCGLAIFTPAVPNGIAVMVTGGLHFSGDEYGHVQPFFKLQKDISHGYLDDAIAGSFKDSGFTVVSAPFGDNGVEFTGTDFSGRQVVMIRDGQDRITTNFEGYDGEECQPVKDALLKSLASRGVQASEQSVSPKGDEKWLTVREIAMNN